MIGMRADRVYGSQRRWLVAVARMIGLISEIVFTPEPLYMTSFRATILIPVTRKTQVAPSVRS